MTAPVIVWFRRDLRLDDHPALVAACALERPVVALFVDDPALRRRAGAPRLAYLHDVLSALDRDTDEHLVVRRGDPVEVVVGLAREVGATDVFVTRDHGPYGRRRDARVAEGLREHGIGFSGVGSNYAVPPGTVRKADGDPYAVFTPFFTRWLGHVDRPPVVLDRSPTWLYVDGDGLPERPDPGCDLPAAGSDAAADRWSAFLDQVEDYAANRDRPDRDGTSRLSPHLKWGTIHPRTMLADLRERGEVDRDPLRTFVSELAWRDFYADVLLHRPHTAWENLRPELMDIEVDTDDEAHRRFDAWCAGRTGFPIVDAGMRQLAATGWMHNRVRMITASFLVKDLHLPWQWGARHFLDHLVDGDLASNNHGWQWAAGTGTDAAPYFRVFNPTTQAERHDPDGAYAERWIPELGTDDAPTPIVDHAAERDEALARYRAVTGRR